MVAKIFYKRFAESGDKDPVPDAAASDGSVSYEQGYSADYSRKLGVDPLAKNVERLKLNRVLFEMTDGIRELQSGAPRPFDSNLAAAIGGYPKWSAVANAAGDLFDSLADNNTAPTTDATKWRQRVLYQIASQVEAEGGNDNTKIMTALRTNQYIAKNVSPSILDLQSNKLNKSGGDVSGPLLMAAGGTNGYMFDVDTGVVSAGDGDVRIKANNVVRVVVTPTNVQFLNTAGTLIATIDNNGFKINSVSGAANLYMGPTGYLVCKDDGTQGGLYMGPAMGWSALFAKTPPAGSAGADVVTAEWIRRFISSPAAGVIDIGDVRLMRGAFVAGDISTWPQESSGTTTFPATFGAEPTVVLGAYGDARLAFMSIIGSPRFNGFDWRGQEPTGTSLQQNYICSYFAMGPKP